MIPTYGGASGNTQLYTKPLPRTSKRSIVARLQIDGGEKPGWSALYRAIGRNEDFSRPGSEFWRFKIVVHETEKCRSVISISDTAEEEYSQVPRSRFENTRDNRTPRTVSQPPEA